MSRRLVVYHHPCSDGFCAAWLFHSVYPDSTFFPTNYGQDLPPVSMLQDADVVLLDFCWPRIGLQHALDAGVRRLIVLDHHATARDVFLHDFAPPQIEVNFDENKSGARLAWEWLWDHNRLTLLFPKTSRNSPPWLVEYTEERDLWRWQVLHSREVNAEIRSWPLDFDVWDRLHDAGLSSSVIESGRSILRAERWQIDAHVKRAEPVTLGGHQGLAVNATALVSEIAGELACGQEFGACWSEDKGKRRWSLRSDADGIDVAALAQQFGGGGHKHAAGFSVPWPAGVVCTVCGR